MGVTHNPSSTLIRSQEHVSSMFKRSELGFQIEIQTLQFLKDKYITIILNITLFMLRLYFYLRFLLWAGREKLQLFLISIYHYYPRKWDLDIVWFRVITIIIIGVVVVVVVVNIFCISLISFHRIQMKFGGKVQNDMMDYVMTSCYDVIFSTLSLIVFDCDSYTSSRS